MPIVGTSPGRDPPRRGAGAFGRVLAEAGPARAEARHGHHVRRGAARSPTRSATRCWCGRPTCWAGAAWRSSTTTARWRGYIDRATEISPEHPVLVDRFLDDAVEIDVDALYDGDELFLGGVMEHIEEAGIHSGDSSCALPPITLGADGHRPDPRGHRGDRPGRRRARPAEHPVRARRRRPLRARGQPAGPPDGAVRVQGDRDPAGQGGGPDDARRTDRRPARRGHAAGAGDGGDAARATRRSRSRRP